MDSHACYIYIRGEYRYLIDVMDKAIAEAYAAGWLGKNIQGDAWFIGYAAAQAPRVVVAVLVVHGGVGGQTAAPIARAVIDAALENP